MDNYELAARFRGKAEGIKVVYGATPPNDYDYKLSAEDRLAFAYIEDIDELCSVVEAVPDNESELEAALAGVEYWKRFIAFCCPCEPKQLSVDGGTATCEKCGAVFVVSLQ